MIIFCSLDSNRITAGALILSKSLLLELIFEQCHRVGLPFHKKIMKLVKDFKGIVNLKRQAGKAANSAHTDPDNANRRSGLVSELVVDRQEWVQIQMRYFTATD